MKYVLSIFLLSSVFSASAKNWYVSVDGNDNNSGDDIEDPLKTIPKAISLMSAGDVIYVRGGVHEYSSTISISKNGTEADTCYLLAYPGEKPVLDFSGTAFGKRGILLSGDYWYIKGFEIIKAGDNGMNISGGGNNVIEFCLFHDNQDTGLQMGNGAHDNTVINCDSYYNADPPDYGDADGFAPKLDVGTNNRFIGCRAWGNCDDGWDGYMRGATNVTTILENCWTWGNGYLKDGTDPGAKANGNGFKMGGGDNSNSQKLTHHFYLTNCVAFDNKGKGFDQNNNAGTMSLLNCSGYGNGSANYRIKKALASGEQLIIKNCLSYSGQVDLGSFAIQETNSWMAGFNVNGNDFVSLDTTEMSAPRKSDGSLPDVNFLHLSEGSDLIDAGTDVGLPYKGDAPDLGAFEYDPETGISVLENEVNIISTPESLKIQFSNSVAEDINYRLYNLNGQMLFHSEVNSPTFQINWQAYNPGIYILELNAEKSRIVRKVSK